MNPKLNANNDEEE